MAEIICRGCGKTFVSRGLGTSGRLYCWSDECNAKRREERAAKAKAQAGNVLETAFRTGFRQGVLVSEGTDRYQVRAREDAAWAFFKEHRAMDSAARKAFVFKEPEA